MKLKYTLIIVSIFLINLTSQSQGSYKIALLKYSGGGDWYANPTSLPNLIQFCNKNLKTNIAKEPLTVEAGSPEIFNYPFIHMTGHGNVIFSNSELKNLRNYLIGGGFLHIDDNYGMDKYIRKELNRLFPDKKLIELPFNHEIFRQTYKFKNGLPKIHEHDGKQPQAFAIIVENKIVLLYTYECDLGDGWEDPEVHNDSKETREKALKIGANIIQYAFTK